MPELPEVETVARGVHARVRGDRVLEIWFGRHREPFKTSRASQAKGLQGRVFLSIGRVGKHIVCNLGETASGVATSQWIVHLGMTGRLLVTAPDAPVAPHTHARLRLGSGPKGEKELRFVDPRRFGRLEFRDLKAGAAFEAPGSEPLLIGPEEFATLFRRRKLSIKAALLNQSLLSGVGNIYADESLFHAGIRPRRQAGRLTNAELGRLHAALQQVLRQAIQLGGSSVSDYVDAEGVRGFFQLEHCVYQRTGEPCRACGALIRRITLAGRSTHYCSNCQK